MSCTHSGRPSTPGGTHCPRQLHSPVSQSSLDMQGLGGWFPSPPSAVDCPSPPSLALVPSAPSCAPSVSAAVPAVVPESALPEEFMALLEQPITNATNMAGSRYRIRIVGLLRVHRHWLPCEPIVQEQRRALRGHHRWPVLREPPRNWRLPKPLHSLL